MTLHLIAHVVNAVSEETAEIEFEIASEVDGRWLMNDGREVWPFWTASFDNLLIADVFSPLEDGLPTSIPEGWIAHIHEIANKSVKHVPMENLAQRLGLIAPKTTEPFKRRI